MDKSFLVRTDVADLAAPFVGVYLGAACVLVYIVKVLLLGRIFKKAGRSSWKAWVPFMNTWTYYEIGGYKGANVFWLIGALAAYCLAPIAGNSVICAILWIVGSIMAIITLVFGIAASVSIQKKLGKPLPFIILLFINLIAPLWMWILALDYSKYNAKKGRVSKAKSGTKKK